MIEVEKRVMKDVDLRVNDQRGGKVHGHQNKSDEKTNIEEYLNLALKYDLGRRRSRERAKYYYEKAASTGNSSAINMLAEFLRDEISTEEAKKRSYDLFRQAARKGHSTAQLNLGYSLFYGVGCKKNRSLAAKYYRKAALAGEIGAMVNLGHMYRRGDGIRKNIRLSIKWYEMASHSGSAVAHFWLGSIFSNPRHKYFDCKKALNHYFKAVELDDNDAPLILAIMFYYGICTEQDKDLSIKFIEYAARRGDPRCQYLLGLCYRDGVIKRKNKRLAERWIERARKNDFLEDES